jgi:hypothetical protein
MKKSTKLSAGDPIEARCTKCRKNSKHTIIALEEEVPATVLCSVCDRQHNYLAPTPLRKPAPKRTVDPHADARKEWAALRPDMNVSKATPYSMDAPYKRGSLMKHPVFGLGLVQRVAGHRKVEVLFEDGRKTMRCQ